jgi:hypothetical protein
MQWTANFIQSYTFITNMMPVWFLLCQTATCRVNWPCKIHLLVYLNSYKSYVSLTVFEKWDCDPFNCLTWCYTDISHHDLLLTKLDFYGVQGTFFKLIAFYLNNRYQRVVIKDKLSTKCFQIGNRLDWELLKNRFLDRCFFIVCQWIASCNKIYIETYPICRWY